MSLKNKTNRRKELGVACIVGALGHLICFASHRCMCGHLKHGRHTEAFSWLTDAIWLSAFILATIIGLRSKFFGAKLTGLIALVVVVSNISTFFSARRLPSPADFGPLVSIPFLIIGLFHLKSGSKEVVVKSPDDETSDNQATTKIY